MMRKEQFDFALLPVRHRQDFLISDLYMLIALTHNRRRDMAWLQGLSLDRVLLVIKSILSFLTVIITLCISVLQCKTISKGAPFRKFSREASTVKWAKEIRKLDKLKHKCGDDLLSQEIIDQRKTIDGKIARKRYMRMLDNERINPLRSKEMSHQPAVWQSATLFFTLVLLETFYFSWKSAVTNQILRYLFYIYLIAWILLTLFFFSLKILWWWRRRQGFEDFIEPLFKEYSYNGMAEYELKKGIKAFQYVYGKEKLKDVALFVNVSFSILCLLVCGTLFFSAYLLLIHGLSVPQLGVCVILLLLSIVAFSFWRMAANMFNDKILELNNYAKQQMVWFKPGDKVNPQDRWHKKLARFLRRLLSTRIETRQACYNINEMTSSVPIEMQSEMHSDMINHFLKFVGLVYLPTLAVFARLDDFLWGLPYVDAIITILNLLALLVAVSIGVHQFKASHSYK